MGFASRSLVEIDLRFGNAFCLHLQGDEQLMTLFTLLSQNCPWGCIDSELGLIVEQSVVSDSW
jgi:hypothetical protein